MTTASKIFLLRRTTRGKSSYVKDESPRSGRLPWHFAKFASVCWCLALTSCGTSEPPPASGPVDSQTPIAAEPGDVVKVFEMDESKASVAKDGAWIGFRADADPIAWLDAQDQKGQAPSSADTATARRSALTDVIARLDERYLEDPRMLANRTAQLMRMLHELGAKEELMTLLRDFSELTTGEEGREDQFGEKCAHYFNLRRAGASHVDAIAELSRAAALRSGQR